MKFTVRKSVPIEVADKLPHLLGVALSWMRNKYPNVNFDNAEYIFSAGYNRSRYFRNAVPCGSYLAPNVCICTRATLYLYDKKSLGIKKNVCRVGYDVQIVCALIHELTHHVQYEIGIRIGNELDTTANELEYLKQFYPQYYTKIVKDK